MKNLRLLTIGLSSLVLLFASVTTAQTKANTSHKAKSKASNRAIGSKIHINTASVAQLSQLAGVGRTLAERIVADRKANGPYKDPMQLTRVKGIGKGIVRNNMKVIVVGPTPSKRKAKNRASSKEKRKSHPAKAHDRKEKPSVAGTKTQQMKPRNSAKKGPMLKRKSNKVKAFSPNRGKPSVKGTKPAKIRSSKTSSKEKPSVKGTKSMQVKTKGKVKRSPIKAKKLNPNRK
jgi:competence ComEA-like helix-hairpin-helix protein